MCRLKGEISGKIIGEQGKGIDMIVEFDDGELIVRGIHPGSGHAFSIIKIYRGGLIKSSYIPRDIGFRLTDGYRQIRTI